MIKITPVLKVFFLIIISLIFTINASITHAGVFFEDCSAALGRSDFKALKDHLNYKTMKKVPPIPTECFRLNNYQFLMTVTGKSMWGEVGQGLYYYDSKSNWFGRLKGGAKQNLKGYKEFLGNNNKRYVLMSWGTLWRGNYTKGYDIINLVPTQDNRSFNYYNLITTKEDPKFGLCGEWSSTDKNTGEVTHHKNITKGISNNIEKLSIGNEGTKDVSIVFTINEENCETMEKTEYKREYKLKNGVFKLIKH